MSGGYGGDDYAGFGYAGAEAVASLDAGETVPAFTEAVDGSVAVEASSAETAPAFTEALDLSTLTQATLAETVPAFTEAAEITRKVGATLDETAPAFTESAKLAALAPTPDGIAERDVVRVTPTVTDGAV